MRIQNKYQEHGITNIYLTLSTADVTNVMCEECSFLHCMKHRLLEDHHCTSLAKEVTQSVVPVLPHSDVKGVVLKRKGEPAPAVIF